MATKEWFESWFDTPYYHQLYDYRDRAVTDAFLRKLVDRLKPAAGSSILEVGCGRGRHSVELAQMGFDVTAVDLSPASIDFARSLEKDNLHFFQHDIRQPFRINYFDYAFNLFNNFGFYRTRREHDAALRTVAKSLHLDGVLVIDYLNTHYVENNLVHESDVPVNGLNFHITKWMDETHFYKKVEVEDDSFTEPVVFTEKIFKFSLGDFTDMLAYQGMQIREVYGDYDFGPYHVRNTPRMIMVARKIKAW